MKANGDKSGTSLTDQAVAWLRERLPQGWNVDRSTNLDSDALDTQGVQDVDSTIVIKAPNGTYASAAVEERQSISPRAVVDLLPPLAQTVRTLSGNVPLLAVAPWLSKRTQELLAEQRINYIDMTGNSLLRLDNPTLYIQTQGSARNPAPKKRGRAQLRGAKAARLIRLLADVRPPYGVRELAAATNLAPGYVSRLLDTLYREALIERSPRGPVESVDVPGLLRRWANSYDVFKTNGAETFVAPAGIDRLLPRLVEDSGDGTRIAITGSFAAARLAPVASPTLLLAYCDSPSLLARDLDLLPADEGANVALLRPFDSIVWERTSIENGLRYAAPSQVVVDCLTGNGRMPAEGEAVLEWMQDNQDIWGLPSLEASKPGAP